MSTTSSVLSLFSFGWNGEKGGGDGEGGVEVMSPRPQRANYNRQRFSKLPDSFLHELQNNFGSSLTHLFLQNNFLSELPSVLFSYSLPSPSSPSSPTSTSLLLEKLQVLDLHSNRLSSIPTSIGRLKQLRELNLENNRIILLPAELSQCKLLEVLLLGKNKLRTLPLELINCSHLRTLDLHDNLIQVFSHEFLALESTLKQLYLYNNPLLSPHNSIVLEGTGAIMSYLTTVSKRFSTRGVTKSVHLNSIISGPINFDHNIITSNNSMTDLTTTNTSSNSLGEDDEVGSEPNEKREKEIEKCFQTANDIPAEKIVELITKTELETGIPLVKGLRRKGEREAEVAEVAEEEEGREEGQEGCVIFSLEELRGEVGECWISIDKRLSISVAGKDTYLINETIFKSRKGLHTETLFSSSSKPTPLLPHSLLVEAPA